MGSTYFNKRIPMRTPQRRPRARPKTFSSKEKAEKYAKENDMKDYEIFQMNSHKFRIQSK